MATMIKTSRRERRHRSRNSTDCSLSTPMMTDNDGDSGGDRQSFLYKTHTKAIMKEKSLHVFLDWPYCPSDTPSDVTERRKKDECNQPSHHIVARII